MSYYIALDPALHLAARDLAAAWNATPSCRQLAEAELVELTPKGFPLDPQLVQQGLIPLAGAAGGFAADASTLVLESLKGEVTNEHAVQMALKEIRQRVAGMAVEEVKGK